MEVINQLKSYGVVIGVMLFLGAIMVSYFSARNLMPIIPEENYADEGVHIFYPYRVLPTPAKNTSASSHDRRMNPTKTVYVVYYAADDGSGYQWSEQASSKSSGQQIVTSGQPVERRVLSIPSENTYITVEPEHTAKSYSAELRQKYVLFLVLSAAYILVYLVIWGVILSKKRQ